jgi:hypothetical protein
MYIPSKIVPFNSLFSGTPPFGMVSTRFPAAWVRRSRRLGAGVQRRGCRWPLTLDAVLGFRVYYSGLRAVGWSCYPETSPFPPCTGRC